MISHAVSETIAGARKVLKYGLFIEFRIHFIFDIVRRNVIERM